MEPANQSGTGLRHALGGLQAGVAGTAAMLACLAVGSLWNQRSVWTGPNLFATTFYGPRVYFNHYAGTGWSGVALLVVLYGTLGALWGWAWRGEQKPMLAVYGAVVGLVVYFILFDFVWKQVNGLVVLYAPNAQLELGHALWGIILAKSPKYSRRIGERIQELPPAAQNAPSDQNPEAVEPAVSSGPVIE